MQRSIRSGVRQLGTLMTASDRRQPISAGSAWDVQRAGTLMASVDPTHGSRHGGRLYGKGLGKGSRQVIERGRGRRTNGWDTTVANMTEGAHDTMGEGQRRTAQQSTPIRELLHTLISEVEVVGIDREYADVEAVEDGEW